MKDKLKGFGVVALWWVMVHHDRWWFVLPFTLFLAVLVNSTLPFTGGIALLLAMLYGVLHGMLMTHSIHLNLPNKEKEKTNDEA